MTKQFMHAVINNELYNNVSIYYIIYVNIEDIRSISM